MSNFLNFATSRAFLLTIGFALLAWFGYRQYTGLTEAVKNLANPTRNK